MLLVGMQHLEKLYSTFFISYFLLPFLQRSLGWFGLLWKDAAP